MIVDCMYYLLSTNCCRQHFSCPHSVAYPNSSPCHQPTLIAPWSRSIMLLSRVKLCRCDKPPSGGISSCWAPSATKSQSERSNTAFSWLTAEMPVREFCKTLQSWMTADCPWSRQIPSCPRCTPAACHAVAIAIAQNDIHPKTHTARSCTINIDARCSAIVDIGTCGLTWQDNQVL
jgi:hypothetical protein